MTNQVTTAIDTGTNYFAFIAFFVVGCLFLLLALTFLPLILISPSKFNLFFSLGSIFIQLSLAFFHGPLTYLKKLLNKENLVISILYFSAVFMAFYSSMIWGTYFFSLIILVLQVMNYTSYYTIFYYLRLPLVIDIFYYR